MPPLTDIVWTVDEAGAFGAAGGGRIPASAASAGYADRALQAQYAAAGAGVLYCTTVAQTGAENFTLTAAAIGLNNVGFITGTAGAISPADYSGNTIRQLYVDGAGGDIGLYFMLTGLLVQGVFTSLELNGDTFLSADADFVQSGGNTSWVWLGFQPISSAGSYAVTITP